MKNILISIKITLAFCVVLFVGYVSVLWIVAAATQPNSGRAEVVKLKGNVVGAANVGQQFSEEGYFWSRPSSVDYNGSASGGSNKGPSNSEYLSDVSARIDAFLKMHPYLERAQVPSEMVTASASGLDPHISVASANVQAQRVAQARGISVAEVSEIIMLNTETSIVGPKYINVLNVNIALDEKFSN